VSAKGGRLGQKTGNQIEIDAFKKESKQSATHQERKDLKSPRSKNDQPKDEVRCRNVAWQLNGNHKKG